MKIFLSLFFLLSLNVAYSDHHHDHDHHDDHHDHTEERREGAVHVHGYNQVNLITNDNIMKLTYTMPIVQLNGQHNDKSGDHDHEHHHDDKEKPNLSNFKNHSLLFLTSKGAKCKLTNYDSKIIEDKNDKNHKDVILDYTFKCKKINELGFIDFSAFKTFNDLEKINFKGIVNNKAFTNLLTKDKNRINFK